MKDPKTFSEKVLAFVKRIPRGETLSYKEVAERVGSPGAARAVGQVMARYDTKEHPNTPCHRVIASSGSLGGYRWGLEKKRRLLKEEDAL